MDQYRYVHTRDNLRNHHTSTTVCTTMSSGDLKDVWISGFCLGSTDNLYMGHNTHILYRNATEQSYSQNVGPYHQ